MHDDWQELLDDIEAYLDDHMDVNDGGDDGRPVPNRAMSLHTRLTTLRARQAALRARFKTWQADDRAGYDQLIDLACEALGEES